MKRSASRTESKEAAEGRLRMYSTRHDLPREDREALVRLLNQRLADTLDLYSQTKMAHWNVKGRDFYQLHQLFDEVAEIVEGHADLLAERATALGGVALGSIRQASSATSLPELDIEDADEVPLLESLIERFGAHGGSLRASIEDADARHDRATSDLFSQLVRDADKALYFLESHLQDGRR